MTKFIKAFLALYQLATVLLWISLGTIGACKVYQWAWRTVCQTVQDAK